jgi:hypothetical protein
MDVPLGELVPKMFAGPHSAFDSGLKIEFDDDR